MKIDELIDKLKRASDGEDCLAVAANLIEEGYRTGFNTEDCRVQRDPKAARFITKDGATVKPEDDVYVAGENCRFEIWEDGTVPFTIWEDGERRDLRADECYSSFEAAQAAGRAGR